MVKKVKQKTTKYTAKDFLVAHLLYKNLAEKTEQALFMLHEIKKEIESCNELFACKEGLYRVEIKSDYCSNNYKVTKIADSNELIQAI